MKRKTIYRAVNVINRYISMYQERLLYYLELKAELKLENGNIEASDTFQNYESDIERYEIILADLVTIKRAIEKGKVSIRTYESADSYKDEILSVLKEARVKLFLRSIKE